MKKLTAKQIDAKEIKAYCRRRAAKAERLLKAYDAEDLQTSVTDALADLLHLCRLKGWQFYELLDSACEHHNAEARGGEHG